MQNSEINEKPKETGNVKEISEESVPNLPLILLRYSDIADFYTEQPPHIEVRTKKTNRSHMLEQILRLRFWIPNQVAHSWMLYSEEREWLRKSGKPSGIVLRNVIWRRNLDWEKVKNASEDNRGVLLNNWPDIKAVNLYLKPNLCSDLIRVLQEGDKILANGILLTERMSDERNVKWCDFEINRMFDWGTVRAIWGPSRENKDVEQYVFKLNDYLNEYIDKDLESIYQLNLDFTYPPEEYKNVVSGKTKGK